MVDETINTNKISKSSFGVFNGCERKFYYNQLGFPWTTNEIIEYGNEAHKILEKYNKGIMSNKKTSEKVPSEFEPILGIYKGNTLPAIKALGYTELVGAEVELFYGYYHGIIDALFKKKDKEEYLIVDFKTVVSLGSFNRDKYKNEMYIYLHLLNKARNIECDNINLAIARFRQKFYEGDFNIIEKDEKEFNSILTAVDKMNKKLYESSGNIKDFPQVSPDKTNRLCQMPCEFYSICE